DEVKGMVQVPLVVAVNKADVQGMEGYLNMSALTGEGVEAVLAELVRARGPSPMLRKGRTR
ncbi:MAG TPA: GTP-binding protein, partial [Methanomicrobiales archaeon]|nr:GTP-binding protein [Methanomicrobiales archaeon]